LTFRFLGRFISNKGSRLIQGTRFLNWSNIGRSSTGTFGDNCNIDMVFLYGLKTSKGVKGALYSGCFGIEFLNSLEIGANTLIDKSVEWKDFLILYKLST
jgi:hypothetical protein